MNPDDISSGGNRGNVNVFFQNSTISWERQVIDMGNTPDAIAMPTLNGGKAAVVVQNWNDNTIHVLEAPQGAATSRILNHTVFPGATNFAGWDSMAAGDLDGDGQNDDAVSALGQWYGNDGARLRLLTADNSGVITEEASIPGSFLPNDVKVGEVTGDPLGRQDIIYLDGGNYPSGRMTIIPMGGSKPITQPVSYVMDDIPEDGVLLPVNCQDNSYDMVVESSGWERQGIKLRNANGAGFTDSLFVDNDGVYTNGGREQILAVEDLNGDGLLDLIKSADYRGLWYRLHAPCVNLTKTAPVQATLGQEFNYTISVSNTGIIPVQGLVITDELPLGEVGISASTGTLSGRSYSSDAINLEPGQSQTITLKVKSTMAGTMVNTAYACEKGACAEPAEATTTITRPGSSSKLTANIVTDQSMVKVNEQFTDTATITNNSPNTTQVVLALYPGSDPGCKVVKISEGWLPGNGCILNDSFLLQPWQSRTVSMTMLSTGAGAITLYVSAAGGGSTAPIVGVTTQIVATTSTVQELYLPLITRAPAAYRL